ETVNLCIPSGTDMCVIDKQVTSHLLRQDSLIGSMFSLFRSASGKACLAFLPEDELHAQLEQIRSTEQVSTKEIDELHAELQQVRNNGVGFDNEGVFKGVRCVAAPIFDHQDRVIATIGISAPVVRLTEQNLLTVETEVRRAAANISRRLGASTRRVDPPLHLERMFHGKRL
ncbi:MAG: IclR family transcriptional regulator, partial [Bilophila sp.]